MGRRWLLQVVVGAVCLVMAPNTPRLTSAPVPATLNSNALRLVDRPDDVEWESWARTDPVRFLDACRLHVQSHYHGYHATLVKQERIGGVLHPTEEIAVTVREKPFAVLMIWKHGARKILGTTVRGTLFVAGQNDGKMIVWRPDALASFLRFYAVSPSDTQARAASRYSITESSLSHTVDRTFQAWSAAAEVGRLHCEYQGKRAIAEVGGRVCHVIQRTCDPVEVDSFLRDDPRQNRSPDSGAAFRTVTIMIDAETRLQVGSELHRADGERIGTYYFRAVVQNPQVAPDQFTPAALKD